MQEPKDSHEPSAIRRAGFRGLVCAVALALLVTLFELIAFAIRGWPAGSTSAVFLGGPLVGVLGGLSTVPIGYVELVLARRAPSLARNIAGGVITYFVAILVLTLAFLQFWYSFNVVMSQSLDRGAREVSNLLRWFTEYPTEFARCLGAGAVPFGFLTGSRLHGHRLAAQTVVAGVGTAVVAIPVLLSVRESWYEVPREDVIVWIVLAGALIPLLAWIADLLERRVVAWLGPDGTR